MIVLSLSDALFAQLQPYLAGLDIAAPAPCAPQLTMRREVYAALVARVGGALDYDVRWQPNEYEPDGFVERIRPLELTQGADARVGCPQCRAQILANRVEVACACGQAGLLL